MGFQKGDTDSARAGGLALQARLRAERKRAADYEAALRTVYMLTVTGPRLPEDRLDHIRRYVSAVLPEPPEVEV